jgi:hypothetical protein
MISNGRLRRLKLHTFRAPGLIFVMLIVSITACGQSKIEERSGETLAHSISDHQQSVASALQTLHLRIDGGANGRNARDYLLNQSVTDEIAHCMAKSGLSYSTEWVPRWFAPLGPPGESWLDPTGVPRFSELAVASAAASRRLDLLEERKPDPTSESTPEYQSALEACTRSPGSKTFTDQLAFPYGTKLSADYHEMVGEVESSFEDEQTSYSACMGRTDLDAKTHEELVTWLKQSVPAPNDVPLAGEEAKQVWIDFLENEQRGLAADAECRGEIYSSALADIEPKLETFLNQHADELASMDLEWASLVERAHNQGWHE